MDIPKLIRDRRRDLHLSQEELAFQIGLTGPEAIIHWEAGTRQIPIERLPALAASLQLDPKEMILDVLKTKYPDISHYLDELKSVSDRLQTEIGERKLDLKDKTADPVQ